MGRYLSNDRFFYLLFHAHPVCRLEIVFIPARFIPIPISFLYVIRIQNLNILLRIALHGQNLNGLLNMYWVVSNWRSVVFLFPGIYEAYVGHKNFSMGRQPAPLDGTNTVGR